MNDCESLHPSRVRCPNNVEGVVLATDSNNRSLFYKFICSLLSNVYSYHPVNVVEEFNRPTKTGLSFDEWYS
jgi:hypothetical protein